jgi:hypothetical protein
VEGSYRARTRVGHKKTRDRAVATRAVATMGGRHNGGHRRSLAVYSGHSE